MLTMKDTEAPELDGILSALANKQRRQIIAMLSLQPASILQLAQYLGVSLPAIHRHIKVLEEAALVQRKKHGRTNFLAIRRKGLQMLQVWVMEYQAYWGTDRETLDNYINGINKSDERAKAK